MPANAQILGNLCVRGGLGPPLAVVHPRIGDLSPSQANTTEALPGRHLPRPGEAAVPPGCAARACDLRKRRRRRPGRRPVPGADCGSRIMRRPPRDGAATASVAADSSCRARNPAPMTLAAELNPHKAELNPHQAVPGGQSHKGRLNGAFRVGRSAGRWRPAMATTRVPAHDVAAGGCCPASGPGPAAYGAPQGWSSGYRVDSRSLGRYRPSSVTPSDRRAGENARRAADMVNNETSSDPWPEPCITDRSGATS